MHKLKRLHGLKKNSEKAASIALLKGLESSGKKTVVVTSSLENEAFLSAAFQRLIPSLRELDAHIDFYSLHPEDDKNESFIYLEEKDYADFYQTVSQKEGRISFVKGHPLVSNAETFLFCEGCDGVLLMEKYTESRYKAFEKCILMLKNIGTDIVGIVPCKHL